MNQSMVKIGHMTSLQDLAIREVRYAPSVDRPFEIFTMADLKERVSSHQLSQHEHIDFELIIVCVAGTGRHEIDFVEIPLLPQRVVRVRHDQVHRWILGESYEGIIVLFQQPTRQPDYWSNQSSFVDFDDARWADLQPILRLTRHRRQSGPLAPQELFAQQTLLIEALSTEPMTPDRSPQAALHSDFRRAVELSQGHSRSVTHYARILGCSTRTLTRACQSAAGLTAKQILDDRVVLQARRLLSLPHRTVASVALELEFSEPTNFVKFFKRHVGQTPTEWQSSNRRN